MMETAWTGNRLTNKIWGDNVIQDDLHGIDVMSVKNVLQHEEYQNVQDNLLMKIAVCNELNGQ